VYCPDSVVCVLHVVCMVSTYTYFVQKVKVKVTSICIVHLRKCL